MNTDCTKIKIESLNNAVKWLNSRSPIMNKYATFNKVLNIQAMYMQIEK